MAFTTVSKKSGKTYHLHLKVQERKSGGKTNLYYFAGTVKEGAIDALPDGFVVFENSRTGLPMLRRS